MRGPFGCAMAFATRSAKGWLESFCPVGSSIELIDFRKE